MKLTEEHGPIFRISVPGTGRVFVSDPDLVDPVCDDSELHEKVAAAVKTASHSVAGTGLFTTEYDDPIWQRAPNILMAPFSQASMRNYIPRWWISRTTDDEVVAHERRRPALRQIYRDQTGGTEQDVEAWMDGRRTRDRFVEDLWGGSG